MDDYDVIIIGAGFAGLQCAKQLGDTDLKVLLIERDKTIGNKVCAGGITPEDLEYIPKKYIESDFKSAVFEYRNRRVKAFDQGIVAPINRAKILQDFLKDIKRFNNITIITGSAVTEITERTIHTKEKNFRFKYLVGADGATSIVRNFLDIPVKNAYLAIQYKIPDTMPDFEFQLDEKKFGPWYLWVFPHKGYTSIGTGTDIKYCNSNIMRSNLELWIKDKGLLLEKDSFEAAIINYDYRGYRFDNIFLAGAAAGLTSGLTGKGIYSASVSGRQIAYDILGKDEDILSGWIKNKNKQERMLRFAQKFPRLFFWIGIRAISTEYVEKKLLKMITK